MENTHSDANLEFTVDARNLYREATWTDLKVASIREMIPVKPDGTDDPGRERVFIGSTQVMTPHGPVPLQAVLEAGTLKEALAAFPQAMRRAMENMLRQLQKLQAEEQQQGSRIIMPGR